MMKRQSILALVTAGLISTAAFAGTIPTQTPANPNPIPTQIPANPKPIPGATSQTPKIIPTVVTMPAALQCVPGYNKIEEHVNAGNGGIDRIQCQSPVYQCPDKSTVKNKKGAAAAGQGIKVEKIPVGSNKFRVKYTCTYFWPQG